MTTHTPRTRIVRHESDLGRWESVLREPDPRLREYVHGCYDGWVESTTRVLRRREVALPYVPVILNLGPAYRLLDPADPARPGEYRSSFVAGLDDACTLVESTGTSLALQVNFTPIGACRFFGLPMRTLAHRVVELEDVLGPIARRLLEQLHDAPCWETRFRILDTLLAARIGATRPAPPGVAWAWQRLEETDGRVDIGTLAAGAGFSHKHLITQFREQLGLPPKLVAQLLRFNHALRLLEGEGAVRWTGIAHRCGYYDQAHMIREFRRFAGTSPTALLRHRLPEGGGVAGG